MFPSLLPVVSTAIDTPIIYKHGTHVFHDTSLHEVAVLSYKYMKQHMYLWK